MRECSHCHLEFSDNALKKTQIDGEELYFCCKGCESVYFLLKDYGLEGFYQNLGSNTLTPPKDNQDNSDLLSFDSESFAQKYIRDKGNFSEISLILEGIHCSACIWLNEKVLNQQDGIYEASINYTNNKANITFDKSKITPSKIITLIRSIGYDAYVYDPKVQEKKALQENRKYYISMIVAIFCTMNIMWIAIAQYAGYFLGMNQDMKDILNLVSFALATPVLFYSGRVFFIGAYYGLKNGFVGMDLLVSLGAGLTYIYSIYASISRIGESYFESVAMIITIVFAGKFLEIKSKKSSGDALDKLNSSIPSNVIVLRGEDRIEKSPQEVQINEIIEVLPGQSLALDGVLLSKEALLNTKAINGETMPVKRLQNDEVLSGCINTFQTFNYKVSKTFENSFINKLARLLEDSIAHKPHIQNLANSLSQYFSKSVLCIGLVTFFGWYFLGKIGLEHSLVIAISVIVISCPCALALATPIATIIGLGEAYKKNLVFKEASFLETMAKANVVVFDKTGTLSKGEPEVVEVLSFGEYDSKILGAFVSQSTHPISQSIKKYLKDSKGDIKDFIQNSARGIEGLYEGKKLLGGSLEFLRDSGVNLSAIDFKKLSSNMVFAYSMDRELKAVFLLQDSLKQNARELIDTLKNMSLELRIVSGDRLEVVSDIAFKLGIEKYNYEVLPQTKAEIIDSYHQEGKIVVMVGDGINDTLALSRADIGISMGAGSDIAIASGDVVVLDDELKSLQEAFKISKKTYQGIKQNIFISIIYNLCMIPLAILGYIIPLFAALSMSLSSLLVVGNSLRIKKKS